MEKTVSIIIPVYNGEQYLSQAIESVLAQSYKNIELILVDDGSSDGTEALAKKYPLKFLKHPLNKGLSAAMNTGLRAAKGDYLMELDSDDWIDKDLVELSLQWFLAKDVDIVGVWQQEEGGRHDIHYFHPSPTHADFLNGNKINCSSMYKRKVYETIGGYDENLKAYMDWQYWLRATKAGFKVATIPLPLFHYRIHKGSMIDNLITNGLRDEAFEKMKDSLPEIFYVPQNDKTKR